MTDQGDVLQIERLDETEKVVAMKFESVSVFENGLIRTPESEKVRCHNPDFGCGKDGNHLAVEIAPAGFSMQAQKNLGGIRVALVKIMAALAIVAGKVFKVVGWERIITPADWLDP